MADFISGKKLLSKHVTRKDRILLVNPPVEETRYSWLRWNQPLDLLRLGAFLKSEIGCVVEMFDCMKPNKQGEVVEEWLRGDRRTRKVKGESYPMRRYGLPCSRIVDFIYERQATRPKELPTQIWITSLCSYWYETINEMCRLIRPVLLDVPIVLIGQYPQLMPELAKSSSAANLIVNSPGKLPNIPHSLDIYGVDKPPFVATQLNRMTSVPVVKAAVADGVYNVAIFEDDICADGGEMLKQVIEETEGLHRHLRYHVICGMNVAKLTPVLAQLFAKKTFASVHFEEADRDDEVDIEVYKRARAYLSEAGVKTGDERFSGFVWIGRPGDNLEQLVMKTFQVLETMGSLILKPYTPSPGSPEHLAHERLLGAIPHREWSPHFFPFAEANGITRGEYHDLYRMVAFLNEKVRDRAFDFLNGTLGTQLLRESLRREVWKLEPSPLRVID